MAVGAVAGRRQLRARSLPATRQGSKKMNGDAELARLSRPTAHTVKLSPQPHSPFTFGLRNRNASFSPCFTKSISVPLM